MDERIAYSIDGELMGAKAKFPTNEFLLPALVEEVGELAKAMMEHTRGTGEAQRVFDEAIQVAAMAIRIAEEGSSEMAYKFEHAYYQQFRQTGSKL